MIRRRYVVEGDELVQFRQEIINQNFKWDSKLKAYSKMINESDKDKLTTLFKNLGLRLVRARNELKRG